MRCHTPQDRWEEAGLVVLFVAALFAIGLTFFDGARVAASMPATERLFLCPENNKHKEYDY